MEAEPRSASAAHLDVRSLSCSRHAACIDESPRSSAAAMESVHPPSPRRSRARSSCARGRLLGRSARGERTALSALVRRCSASTSRCTGDAVERGDRAMARGEKRRAAHARVLRAREGTKRWVSRGAPVGDRPILTRASCRSAARLPKPSDVAITRLLSASSCRNRTLPCSSSRARLRRLSRPSRLSVAWLRSRPQWAPRPRGRHGVRGRRWLRAFTAFASRCPASATLLTRRRMRRSCHRRSLTRLVTAMRICSARV